MLRLVGCVVLYCTVSFGQSYAYAATPVSLPVTPPLVPPVLAPISPFTPTAYPLTPNSKPVIPGVAGYNPLVPGVFPAVTGYNSPLIPGVAGYNNQYYNQFRTPGAAVPILTYSSDHAGDGAYSFSFTTADGKQAQEAGYLKDAYINNAGEPQGTQVVQGSYAYISPEGTPVQVNYIADENGFRPSGVHIPANGKPLATFIGNKEKQILDPLYNQYDSLYRHRYNGVGAFNRRSYDTRKPYESAKYNPYFNNQYSGLSLIRDTNEIKKTV